jgi:hypothetical protein
VLVLALLWGSLALYLQYDKSQALANANRSGENLARAFAEHITRILRSIDQTLRGVVRDYEQAPTTFNGSSAVAVHAVLSDATSRPSSSARVGTWSPRTWQRQPSRSISATASISSSTSTTIPSACSSASR